MNEKYSSTSTSWFLLYLSAIVQGLTFWRTPLYDPDLGFLLLGGAFVAQFNDVPRADFINVFNTSWVDYHWLGQLVIYLILAHVGTAGVQAVCGLLGALLGVLMVAIVRRSARDIQPVLALILVTVILSLLFGTISTRPTSMAVVAVVFGLLVLLQQNAWTCTIFFLLTALCANIHVYWVLFPVLWAMFFCVPRFIPGSSALPHTVPRSAWYVWGGLCALLFAGSLSPYGIFNPESGLRAKLLNYHVFIDVAVNPTILKHYVSELQPGFSTPGYFLFFALIAFGIAAHFFTTKKVRENLFPNVLFLGTFLLCIAAQKYKIFFAFGAVPLCAPLLVEITKSFEYKIPIRWTRLFLLLVLVSVPLYFTVIAWSSNPFREDISKKTLEELEIEQPLRACTALRNHFPKPTRIIRVSSPYDYGGWCAWALNQVQLPSPYRLTMDGRTQFVPVERIVSVFSLYDLGPEWEETLERIRPDAVLVTREQALGQLLKYLPDQWKLIYTDSNFGVFVRVSEVALLP